MKDVLLKISFFKMVEYRNDSQFEKSKNEILFKLRELGYSPVVEEEDYRDEDLISVSDLLGSDYFDQFSKDDLKEGVE